MRIRTRSLIIIFSQVLYQATTLAMGVVLVRVLSKHEYGTFMQVELVCMFPAMVFGASLPASLYYFIPKFGEKRRAAVLSSVLLVCTSIGAVVTVLLFVTRDAISSWFANPEIGRLLLFFSVYPLVRFVLLTAPAFFISIDRPVRAGCYSTVVALTRGGSVICGAILGLSLSTIFGYYLATSVIVAIILLWDMFRFTNGGLVLPDKQMVRSQLNYITPMLGATAIGVANRQLGRFITSVFLDSAAFAVFTNGAFELPVVGIITSSVFMAIMPNLVRFGDKSRLSDALQLWRTAVRKCSLAIYPAFVLAMVNAQDLIVLMFTREYAESVWPFIAYLLILPIRVAVYGAFLRAFGRTKPILFSALIGLGINAVVGIALAATFRGTWLGFVGPAIGALVAELCSVSYMIRSIARTLGVGVVNVMPWRGLASIMVLCGLSGIMAWLLPLSAQAIVVRILMRCVVFTVTFLTLAVVTKSFQKDEMDMLLMPIRTIRNSLIRHRS